MSARSAALKALIEEVFRKQLPEIGERMVTDAGEPVAFARAAKPEGLGFGMRERAPGVPFSGPESIRGAARATTAAEPTTPGEAGNALREFLGGFYEANPELPKHWQAEFMDHNVARGMAEIQAKYDVMKALDPIKDNHLFKVTKLGDLMYLADRMATVTGEIRAGKRAIDDAVTPTGGTLHDLEKAFTATASEVADMPDVTQSHRNVRELLDRVFQELVDGGQITLDRYRDSYLPREQLDLIMEAVGRMNKSGTKVVGQTLRRGAGNPLTQTNLVPLLLEHLTDYYKTREINRFFQRIVNDPNVNFTRYYQIGDQLRKGHVVYAPGPGMPGFGTKMPELVFADGVQHSFGVEKGRYSGYGVVLPESMATALQGLRNPEIDPATRKIYKAGQMWARAMTVYNPRNTTLNMISDLFLALVGMPGEKARPLGILRFEPAAIRAAFKGAFGKTHELVDVPGMGKVDVYKLAEQSGITGSTLVHDVGGVPFPQELVQFMDETAKPHGLEKVGDFMTRVRQAVEMSPRIAAGLEALARTEGDVSEFGRVGREITLPYGYGAPKHARNPFIRFLTPFIQFTGLASKRIYDVTTTPGSRLRGVSILAAVPAAVWAWNNQNDNYKKVSASIKEYERDQMYVIWPDWKDPSKPALDRYGKPIVLRCRYFVPEEILRTYGVGNLPTRGARLLSGRQKPIEFAAETGRAMRESIAFQMGPVASFHEMLTGRSLLTGAERTPSEALSSLTPQTRALMEAKKAFDAGGPTEGLKMLIEQTLGASFSRMELRGKIPVDADIAQTRREIRKAMADFRVARGQGDAVRMESARDHVVELRKRLAELGKIQQRGQ